MQRLTESNDRRQVTLDRLVEQAEKLGTERMEHLFSMLESIFSRKDKKATPEERELFISYLSGLKGVERARASFAFAEWAALVECNQSGKVSGEGGA